MKTENQSCCFCFHIASGENTVDLDILDLLKFLIVNLNTSALENCPVCDSCLNKILETSEYKRRNSTKTVDVKKKIDCEKSVCQKCEKVCEQGDTSALMDCITQLDWSDFVNYLFPDQDSQSLENLQICGSCRASVSNIQDFLMLIYVHDQSKMKCDIDNSNNVIVTENENLVRDKVEIKQEFENFTMSDKTEIQSVIEDNKAEMICSDSKRDSDTTYADFKCKNEEVELKCESEDSDDDQSSNRCEKEITSRSGSLKNSLNNEEEQEINTQGCSNELKYDRNFKCIYCSDRFTTKLNLHNHLLRIHKCRDGVTSKIYDCNECNYMTTNKSNMVRHGVKHGIKGDLVNYKCQYCIYTTYSKSSFIKHTKTHNDRDFKCTLCSKSFTDKRNLNNHVLKVHKNKDSVFSKIYECDKCSYSTTRTSSLLKHELKHDITVKFERYKCPHCIYETYNKSNFVRHIKIHNNVRDFKCTLCSKSFTARRNLSEHFLMVHNNKDSVSKMHECDKCSYSSTRKSCLLIHKLKHGVTVGFKKYICQHCLYETYIKSHLIRHIKTHSNIRDFKCTLCPYSFIKAESLNDHLLKVHKSRNNITSKILECDECSYETTIKCNLLKHKLKHGIGIKKERLNKYKCHNCIYETYDKSKLIAHIKTHYGIRDFKCSLCSKRFAEQRSLDDHLLKFHQNKDSVVSKIHECDKCSYSTSRKSYLLRHKLKHDITVGLENYKCQQCIYETYDKSNLITHIKTHYGIRDFKCTLCSKNFTQRVILDDHLLKVHNNKDSIVNKIHECDKCNYSTTRKCNMLRHGIKHGVKVGLEKYKCQNCVYETYDKSSFIRHVKTHNNILEFKCTLCLKNFTRRESLDDHLLRVHNHKDSVVSKIHECDQCNYSTTRKKSLLGHKSKHV